MSLRGIWVLLSAMIASCAVPHAMPSSLTVPYLYTEGMKAELLGDPRAAVELFEEVIARDSTHAPSYFELASLLVQSDASRAMEYARKASRLDSTNVWYRMLWGRLMVMSGDYAQAQRTYEELVRLAPANPENYRMLAALYQQQDSPYAAIATITQAEKKLGPFEEFSSLLGSLYLQTGQDSLGLEALQSSLQLDPGNREALLTLASYYRSKGRIADFFVTARQLVASDQVAVNEKVTLIEELQANRPFYQEHFFAIRDLVVNLLARHPSDWRAIDLYGTALLAMNGVEPALAFYKSNLQRDSVPVTIYHTVLEMEAYLKQPDSLAHYAAQALRRFPDDSDLYLRLGGAYTYLDLPGQALDAYRQALRHASVDSMRSVIYGVIGDHYHADSNARQTYRYYELALKADPDNAMVLNNFAYYLTLDPAQRHQLPRAISMAERAIALSTGNATYLDTYAWALFMAGRLPEAKKIMQQAISLDTSGSETLYDHYGDILAALGETFMARLYYQKALDKTPDNPEILRKFNSLK